jgi:serine/threonine-protein kinase
MSPEQAFGKPLDRRTDVYAVAVVLWEMLTMRRAFKADNDLALLDVVRSPQLVAPGSLVAGVPPALDRAVLAALAPNADQRPATAQAFRRSLLEAVPSAAALDSSALATLLLSAMSERIEEERSTLPESVSAIGPRPVPSNIVASAHDDPLDAHTISLTSMPSDALSSDDGRDDSVRSRPVAVSLPTPSLTVPAVARSGLPPPLRSQTPRVVLLAVIGAVCFVASGTLVYMRRTSAGRTAARVTPAVAVRVEAAPPAIAVPTVVDVVEAVPVPPLAVVTPDVAVIAEVTDAAVVAASVTSATVTQTTVEPAHHHAHGSAGGASASQQRHTDAGAASTSGPLVAEPGF